MMSTNLANEASSLSPTTESVNRTGVSGDFILWERWSHVLSNEQEVPARTA
ncbi:hypothetical protein RHOER0001_4599 [Rhodococcus erythropolis SK121]|nr:hypothetical protein RHOER0001_4599 [Rhodococcus erythropolis SK121]